MAAPLLPTRLALPPVRAGRVARPRLLRSLEAGLAGSVTLITAPAGSGKTTLAVEWVRQAGRSAAWLSLEETENDPNSFLAYLVAALGSVVPDAAQVQPLEPTPSCIAALITVIAAAGTPLILVLDDLHAVTNPAVYDLLAYLTHHLPGNLHLALCSRETPPIPLARLRARGLLNEVQVRDLRFTEDEAAELFNKVLCLNLPAESIRALAGRAEGWATGLQLFGLALARGETAPDAANITDGEGERYVMDYLAEEVLRRQPEEIQSFLLRTGVLDRFNAELCQAVIGDQGAGSREESSLPADELVQGGKQQFQAILEDLERANLFIVPLDGQRTWFRYHALFADFLRRSLDRRAPGMARRLNRRAAEWHAARGLPDEAVEYALRGQDYDRAAGWMGQLAFRFFGDGRSWAVTNWLKRLPEEVRLRHPRLLLFQVWMYIEQSRTDQAVPLLESIERLMAETPAGPVAYPEEDELAVTRLTLLVVLRRLDEALTLALEMEKHLPPGSTLASNLVQIILGLLIGHLVDMAEGARRLDAAAQRLQAEGAGYMALNAMCNQGDLYLLKGCYHLAAEAYGRALEFANRQPQTWLMAGWPSFSLGQIYTEWNELEKAWQYLQRGMELVPLIGSPRMNAGVRLALAWYFFARGDAFQARQAVEQAATDAAQPGVEVETQTLVTLNRLRLLWLCGERPPLARWVQALPFDRAALANHRDEALVWLRWLAWDGPAQEAVDLAAQLRGLGGFNLRDVVLLDWLDAQALDRLGQAEKAAERVRAAVSLAEPQGYLRLFIDEGPNRGALLRRVFAGEKAQPGGCLARLLSACGSEPDQPAGPLSPREVEILALAAGGLSNAQIAAKLVIAPGTVKKHLDNIFLKLGAGSRAQAVAIAREKGWV